MESCELLLDSELLYLFIVFLGRRLFRVRLGVHELPLVWPIEPTFPFPFCRASCMGPFPFYREFHAGAFA